MSAALNISHDHLAEILRWIDGDSLVVKADLDFRIYHVMVVRVYGIDAPEVVGATKAAGLAAKAFAESLLPVGVTVKFVSHMPGDKYGRWLASIELPDGSDFSAKMIEAGHAVAYLG